MTFSCITEKGYGKRTPVADYPEQNRGGQGVYTIQMTIKKGLLAGLKVVAPQHELMIISTEGVVIRVKVNDISQLGRSTQGVKIDGRGRRRQGGGSRPYEAVQAQGQSCPRARRRSTWTP